MTKVRLPKDDPRHPNRSLLAFVLTLLILGWFLWVLASWPDSVVSHWSH